MRERLPPLPGRLVEPLPGRLGITRAGGEGGGDSTWGSPSSVDGAGGGGAFPRVGGAEETGSVNDSKPSSETPIKDGCCCRDAAGRAAVAASSPGAAKMVSSDLVGSTPGAVEGRM